MVKSGFATNEEQLATIVEPIGPLVAIGTPGEKLPPPGAIREYASDSEWQDAIKRLLSSARLIILRPGMSEGLWWEIHQVISTVDPEQFLLLMIDVTRAEYEAFAGRLHHTLNIALPAFETLRRRRVVSSLLGFRLGWVVSGLFEFRPGWYSQFLPLRVPYWRRSPFQPWLCQFNHAMQPVFSRLGIPWAPSPISVVQIIKITGLVLLALVLILSTTC